MTVSINSLKTIITIKSSLLETPWSGITSVTLTVKQACGTSVDLTIEEADANASGEFSFNEDDAGFDFSQGVYSFTLKVDSSSVIETEYYCFFNDIDISCRVRSVVASTSYTEKEKMYIMLLHHQLTQSNICHKSTCQDYCTIYKDLINELSMLSC